MRCKALRHRFPWVVLGILMLPGSLFAQKGLSHVRVVRLSYVSGTVGVKRPAATEWAKAQVNTPIQEGFELSTAASSYAEVEFENGSTARLGEFSRVNFDQLAMDENGNKLNRLTFEQGYATFHFLPEHQDAYSVRMAESTLAPVGKSEFRADLGSGRARVEVFAGTVEVSASGHTARVGKDKVLEFDPEATEVALNATPGIAKDAWDKWTAERDTQERMALADQAVPGRGLYGWSDLDVYGEWGYFPGFGLGWSPYAAAGWSPYSMGMWSSYPGMGYAWISSEPWGWLPYHYGNWNFSPGFGWFWMANSFGDWSPALVSWYSGPGWIGWAPLGAQGTAGQSIVTTVAGAVIQNGLRISPQNSNSVTTTAGTLITHMPLEPGAGAMLSGVPLPSSAEALFTPRSGTPHTLAPPAILLGGSAEKEQSLQTGRSAYQPLRARLGTTLGGYRAVDGAVGEFRGDAATGARGLNVANGPQGPRLSRGARTDAPTLLPHGQQTFNAPPKGGGGMTPSGSGGGGVGGAGGNLGNPTPSAGTSAGGHSASSGGGHH